MNRPYGDYQQNSDFGFAPAAARGDETEPGVTQPRPRRRAHAAKRSRRRAGVIAAAVALGVLVLGGGAFGIIRVLEFSSVDPADRLPDSVAMYAEVNLDPSLDQTPKLFDLVDKFGGFDELDFDVESFEELIHKALQEVDADFLEPSELTSWVGTRAAVAGGATQDDELYGVFALASRDDEAAESAMIKIVDELERELDQEAAGVDVGHVVDDGLVIVVVSESDAQSLAGELLADGRQAPLSGSEKYGTAMNMFDGDQTMLFWYDMDRYYEAMDALFARFEDEFAMQDLAALDLEAFSTTDATWLAVGAAATDDGIDIWYHSDSEIMDSAVATDWRDRLGDLPMSQAAGVINLPDNLDNLVSAQLDLMESQLEELSALSPDATLPNLEYYTRGEWDYDEALGDEELAEWSDLVSRYEAGDIAEGDADFDRLVELNDQYVRHGAQAEYDEWVAGGGESEQQWMFEQALSHEEFRELDEYESLVQTDSLPAGDEERYINLMARMVRFGVVSDYELYDDSGVQEMADVRAAVEEVVELVSGSGIVFSLQDAFADEPAGGVSITLEEGPAERIFELPETGEFLREAADELGDDLVFDGPTVTFGELAGDEALATHPDFHAAFDGAPEAALMAVFVDVAALNSAAPEPEEWLEPVRAVSWVNGNRSGLIRVLIE